MPDASSLAVFVVASVALLVTPGPAVLYVVTRSLDEGRGAGLVSAAGVGLGTLGHVLAATIGLSALLSSSAAAFTAVKLLGASYLIWIGIRRIVARPEDGPSAPLVRRGPWATFRRGAVVNLLNPKTALFFLAFLPQFVDHRSSVAPQMLVLGLAFVGLGIVSDGLFALLASSVRPLLLRGGGARVVAAQRFVTGGLLVVLGVTTALTRRGA